MNIRSPIARTALACAAAAATLAGVTPALAQGPYNGQAYDSAGQYYYDGCARDQNSRAVGGGLIGLLAGAAAGSNLAGRHNRDEGAVLGGVLGAMIGAGAGRSTAACTPQYSQAPQPPVARYRAPAYSYYQQRGYSYYDQPSYPQPIAPQAPYYDQQQPVDDGCRMVESEIRMPDGRTQTRMVKTCPDSRGRYQIVD